MVSLGTMMYFAVEYMCWVFIVNFSGLSEIYLVRVTKSMHLSLLTKQFNGHLLCCRRCTDKVLYAIKKRIFGHNVCYNMLLATIKGYLENTNAFNFEQDMQFDNIPYIKWRKRIMKRR